MNYNDELMHYGVKGMKWGVRHDYVPVGRNRATTDKSAQNSKNAKKDRKAYERAIKDYRSRVRKGWVDNYNRASHVIDRDISPKYNKMLEKEGLTGKNFAKNMKDPIKKARYDEILDAYNKEVGKRRTELFIEEFGEEPSWRTWKSSK